MHDKQGLRKWFFCTFDSWVDSTWWLVARVFPPITKKYLFLTSYPTAKIYNFLIRLISVWEMLSFDLLLDWNVRILGNTVSFFSDYFYGNLVLTFFSSFCFDLFFPSLGPEIFPIASSKLFSFLTTKKKNFSFVLDPTFSAPARIIVRHRQITESYICPILGRCFSSEKKEEIIFSRERSPRAV